MRLVDGEFRDFADMLAADFDAQRLGFQAVAVAGVAFAFVLVFGEFLAHVVTGKLFIAAFQVGNDA